MAGWRDGFVALFDGAGNSIAQSAGAPEFARHLRIGSGPDRKLRLTSSAEGQLQAALAPVGGTGWHVAAGAPDAAVAEALQKKIWILATVGAVGVLLSVAAAALVGRFLLGEARTLVATAERISDEGSEVPVPRVRELEALQRALIRAGSAMRERAAAAAWLLAAAEHAALLEKRVAERTRDLEETTGHLLSAQDEERRRIARDIHDSTVQELVATSLSLVRAETALDPEGRRRAGAALAGARASLHRAEEELRTVSFVLQPPLLDECGLGTALQVYAEGFSKRTGIAVTMIAEGPPAEIRRTVEAALFRVVQEALANVDRHAKAHSATIRLWTSAEDLCVLIEDDGRGMPARNPNADKVVGVGIPSMRARLRQLGGELEIRSTSSGTRVIAHLPNPISSSTEAHLNLVPCSVDADTVRSSVVHRGDRCDANRPVRHSV